MSRSGFVFLTLSLPQGLYTERSVQTAEHILLAGCEAPNLAGCRAAQKRPSGFEAR